MFDTIDHMFEVSGWQSTGGTTLGLRFGAINARAFVDRSLPAVFIELDGTFHEFAVRPSFWRSCPEIRGKAITSWDASTPLRSMAPRGAPSRLGNQGWPQQVSRSPQPALAGGLAQWQEAEVLSSR